MEPRFGSGAALHAGVGPIVCENQLDFHFEMRDFNIKYVACFHTGKKMDFDFDFHLTSSTLSYYSRCKIPVQLTY